MSRIGGWAGIGAAITYLVGFALAGTLLTTTVGMTAGQMVAFLVDHETVMQAWSLVIYLLNGVLLVLLTIALYDRLAPHAPDLARVAAAFGLIWAGLVIATGMLRVTSLAMIVGLHGTDPGTAATLWPALEAIQEGLGGAVEVPGGLWVLLVGLAGLRSGALPKGLGHLGIGNGLAGILTLVPGVELFAMVFGLGMLAWFGWAGVVLVRAGRPAHAGRAASAGSGAVAGSAA